MQIYRTVDSSTKYEKALDAIMGQASYQFPYGEEDLADLILHRPSVTLHETATPLPTILRIRRLCNMKARNFFKIEPFSNYISKRDYRTLLDEDGEEIWLKDGDLTVTNCFCDNWKADAWIEDLANTRNGIGIYIANSRGNTEVLLSVSVTES